MIDTRFRIVEFYDQDGRNVDTKFEADEDLTPQEFDQLITKSVTDYIDGLEDGEYIRAVTFEAVTSLTYTKKVTVEVTNDFDDVKPDTLFEV